MGIFIRTAIAEKKPRSIAPGRFFAETRVFFRFYYGALKYVCFIEPCAGPGAARARAGL